MTEKLIGNMPWTKLLFVSALFLLFGCLNNGSETVMNYQNKTPGSWEHHTQCPTICINDAKTIKLAITNDSIYADMDYRTDIGCPPSGCPFKSCTKHDYSKGKWWSNVDSIRFQLEKSDSTYTLVNDTCSNSLYLEDTFKYFFRNDSLILQNGRTGEMGFRKL